MKLNLISFTSELNNPESVRSAHAVLLSEIENYFTLNLVFPSQLTTLDKEEFNLVFIASGGTERKFIQHFEELPHPITLLTDGLQNSLAAALEIMSWLRRRGLRAQIIHGDIHETMLQIFRIHRAWQAGYALSKKRIGVVGTPASWLIASQVDYLLAKQRWGITYHDIGADQLYEYFQETQVEDVNEMAAQFSSRALACREASSQDLLKAMRLYKALQRLCHEEKLDALTLSCFSLIEKLNTTGCLALSLLNDEGIPAGCEGDLQSIFTLLATQTVTGEIGFMANPALIHEKENEVVLAHCTIGTKQTEQFIIRNHFETQSGVAIQGILPAGDITLVKCGGECLDEYFISAGRVIENTNYLNACRTQVLVQLDNPASYFLRNPIGNHHILLTGNRVETLNEFFQAYGCRRMD